MILIQHSTLLAQVDSSAESDGNLFIDVLIIGQKTRIQQLCVFRTRKTIKSRLSYGGKRGV
jgi:hypothetical protein